MRTIQSESFAHGFLSALEKKTWDPELHPRDIIGRFAEMGAGFGTPKGPVQTVTVDKLKKTVPKDKQGRQFFKGVNVEDIYTYHKFDPKETGLDYIIMRRTSETDSTPIRVHKYTKEYEQKTSEKKFLKAERMANVIRPLRDRMDLDARSRKDESLSHTATVAKLVDETAMRIGGGRTEKDTGSVGASTIRVEHVKETPGGLHIRFQGKSDQKWSVDVKDATTVKNIKEFMAGKKKGDRVFHTDCDIVNKYLRDRTRNIGGITAKDFRTFHGGRVMLESLEKMPPPKTAKDIEKNIKKGIDITAAFLNHSPAVCKAKYVNPRIIEDYQQKWSERMGG
jgi:hypothetical protein